jgi:hypothetical protein
MDMSTDLDSEIKMPELNNQEVKAETPASAPDPVSVPEPATFPESTTLPEEENPQFQAILDKFSAVLANLPDYVTDFFKEYKRPLVTVGLILAAFVSVKLLLAILDAINEVPLLAPTFELIGLSYSAWFVYRFLLKDVNRQELAENFTSLKDQVLGKRA